MLVNRLYEIDLWACPECGGQGKVVALIASPKACVIEKIPQHCVVRRCPGHHLPDTVGGHAPDTDTDNQPAAFDKFWELTFVNEATFWSTA